MYAERSDRNKSILLYTAGSVSWISTFSYGFPGEKNEGYTIDKVGGLGMDQSREIVVPEESSDFLGTQRGRLTASPVGTPSSTNHTAPLELVY